ncbi:siroheme synthase CysG [Amorphus orientalis]|uniref:Uroporphyrin-III C-methyltransferase/precorrin-2 dehydrogenase/sirohydrochlorin ferrochelatase n=1 Tax=Amorphus orientalis TaxID=649198 RepID=A0AAE4ASP4_9HYPH|nr:siroheme synthase CysG [Amorphus orientalis]MDQ0315240.1 uroporphyrin-III C-methyltransferase/precorrin-2 dehydrogenase/sirohydrochlorin ferrochelatase [Amorphus orientalis]
MSAAPHTDAGKLSVFPTFHRVEGRRVVIVGGGDEAGAKIRLLSETNAHLVVIAPELSPAASKAVQTAGASWHARDFSVSDVEGAALVFAASGEEADDRAVVDAARAAGVPVNAVDRPEICDFYVGALVNRAPVAVAITSSGTGPVLARHIRAKIEAMLPRETGALARIAENLRDTIASVFKDGVERRRYWERFFAGSVADTLREEGEDAARHTAETLIGHRSGAGYVTLVGAGPGAEDLLTLRAQRVLQEADVIVHDQLVPDAVVAMGRRDAERVAVGKAKGAHSVTQQRINEILVERARRGERVVRLKSGDPMIFGRAGEEIAALEEADIAYEIVPGVTAALAAASSAKIPLTLRGVTSSVVFATGHDKDGGVLPDWANLALSGSTVAVYMGRTVAGKIATRLMAAGLKGSTPVGVVENAARSDERLLTGRLDDLPALARRPDVSGPVLIVIGEAVAHAGATHAQPLAAERAFVAAA